MDNRLWAGKLSRYGHVCSHLGQLSLPTPLGSVNRVPASLAGVTAGCVHLCRVAGNTAWSHMASDNP